MEFTVKCYGREFEGYDSFNPNQSLNEMKNHMYVLFINDIVDGSSDNEEVKQAEREWPMSECSFTF